MVDKIERIPDPDSDDDFPPHHGWGHDTMPEADRKLADMLSKGNAVQRWTLKQSVDAWNLAASAWNLALMCGYLFILFEGGRLLALIQGAISGWIAPK